MVTELRFLTLLLRLRSNTVIDLSLSLLNWSLGQVVVLTVDASAKLKIKRTLKYQHLFFMFIYFAINVSVTQFGFVMGNGCKSDKSEPALSRR